ncbi:hypothetical protein BH23ACT3_BH23ACT3_05820 [soil metagenome]
MGHLDQRWLAQFGKDIQHAPVAEHRYGRSGHQSHHLGDVAGTESGVVERGEELGALALSPLEPGESLRIATPTLVFGLGVLVIGDVGRAPDRSRDLTVIVERHAAAALHPTHGAVGKYRPVLDHVRTRFVDRMLDRREHLVDVVWVEQRDPGVERAVERTDLETEQSLHRRIPEGVAGPEVPVPGAQSSGFQGEREMSGDACRVPLERAPGADILCRDDHRTAADGRHERADEHREADGLVGRRPLVAPRNDQIAAPRLPRGSSLEHLACQGLLVGPHDHVDHVMAHRFDGRYPRERFGRPVPRGHPSVGIDLGNGQRERVDQGSGRIRSGRR